MNNDIIFWHALRLTFDFGFETYKKIKKVFGKPRHAWQASSAFYQKHGFEKSIVEKVAARKQRQDPGDLFRNLLKQNIQAISHDSKDYPQNLKEISSPPPVLYYKGNIQLISKKNLISMVGTRKATSYGKAVVQMLVGGLVETDCIIVSGMAFGIDSEAHKAALKNNLKTIAVLGSGLDDAHIYPQSHLSLSNEILKKGGLILSEHPPGTEAFKSHFPRRNRIISGLSRGTVIVEAKEPSGALITAMFALEQNREVFSVPGSIFAATSDGCHRIIQLGAKLTRDAEDILVELNISKKKDSDEKPSDPILEILSKNPLDFDEISIETKLDSQLLSTKLLELELNGRVAKKGGMYYKV
jgi:DNA processing protein